MPPTIRWDPTDRSLHLDDGRALPYTGSGFSAQIDTVKNVILDDLHAAFGAAFAGLAVRPDDDYFFDVFAPRPTEVFDEVTIGLEIELIPDGLRETITVFGVRSYADTRARLAVGGLLDKYGVADFELAHRSHHPYTSDNETQVFLSAPLAHTIGGIWRLVGQIESVLRLPPIEHTAAAVLR